MVKQFDYQGAKKAGYSDEEIMQHLAQSRPKFDIQGAMAAGYSPEEINEHLAASPVRSKSAKAARLAGQFAIGQAENALLPYELAVAPLASQKAQHGEYRRQLLEDIERLQEQKAAGQWDKQDQQLYDSLVEQVKNPEKAQKFVKTADIGVRGLAEIATGLDLQPEGFSEHAANIAGNFLSPKQLLNLPKNVKSLPKHAKALLNKETRQAIKVEKQWKNLDRAAASNPEKETLLKFAKSHGLTPEETNLLFHSKGQSKFLETLGKKSNKLKDTVRGLKDKLGKNYEKLKQLGHEGGELNASEIDHLTDDIYKILKNTGKTFVEGTDTESARKVIEKTIHKINNESGTVEHLINSRQGLKQGVNWRNVDQGDVILKEVDNAFLDAIRRKNPYVYENLVQTDRAYAKFKQFSKVLQEQTPIFNYKGLTLPAEYGQYLAFGLSALFGPTIPVLKTLALKEIGQRLLTEIAINPAFQAPLRRMQQAALKGSRNGQKQAFLVIKHLLKTEDPELYKEIKDLNVD